MDNRIPFTGWYYNFFKDRVVFLTGVGRSGTSILGKLIGSSRPVYYLFEPNFIKFCLIDEIAHLILFEDFVMPLAQGLNLNINSRRESWSGHCWTDEEVMERWDKLVRRIDLLPLIELENPKIVIKVTEWQMMADQMNSLYDGSRYIHIIRNGNDVVMSSIKAGWWNDQYMLTNFVDWVNVKEADGKVYNVPWYIDDESKENWHRYNRYTRSACAWRCCLECAAGKDFYTLRYEDLCDNPAEEYDRLAETMNIKPTGLTRRHIADIQAFKRKPHEKITYEIEQPERGKFIDAMKAWGY